MTVRVVDAFQLVDVEHHHRQRTPRTARALQLAAERFNCVGAVETAGQLIADAALSRLRQELDVADRNREE
jgi:hypothetical protein